MVNHLSTIKQVTPDEENLNNVEENVDCNSDS